MKDLGLLETTLYRQQTGHYTDLIEQAAALWESLSKIHPFVDGKKHTAFAGTYTFVAFNGRRMNADADRTLAFIAGLHERGMFSFQALVDWLRKNVSPEYMYGVASISSGASNEHFRDSEIRISLWGLIQEGKKGLKPGSIDV